MNTRSILGFILMAIGVVLYVFSSGMDEKIQGIQHKLAQVEEKGSSTPPALIERPVNRMRQRKSEAVAEKSEEIGERTLDQYKQLILLVQLASAVFFISGLGVCVSGFLPKKQ